MVTLHKSAVERAVVSRVEALDKASSIAESWRRAERARHALEVLGIMRKLRTNYVCSLRGIRD